MSSMSSHTKRSCGGLVGKVMPVPLVLGPAVVLDVVSAATVGVVVRVDDGARVVAGRRMRGCMSAGRVMLVGRCLTTGMLSSIVLVGAHMLGRVVDSVLVGPVGGDGRTAAMCRCILMYSDVSCENTVF